MALAIRPSIRPYVPLTLKPSGLTSTDRDLSQIEQRVDKLVRDFPLFRTTEDLRLLQRWVATLLSDTENIYSKIVAGAHRPLRGKSGIGALEKADVLLRNIYQIKHHVERFTEFAEISERIDHINAKLNALNEGKEVVDRMDGYAVIRHELRELFYAIVSLEASFAVRPLLEVHEERFNALTRHCEALISRWIA